MITTLAVENPPRMSYCSGNARALLKHPGNPQYRAVLKDPSGISLSTAQAMPFQSFKSFKSFKPLSQSVSEFTITREARPRLTDCSKSHLTRTFPCR